ncbi:NAD-dependent protein deacetylase sirtuin-7 [Neocloeon triangulifer]|uniref:NAD-dependent protein deacetylase sirtuin-7 n=1 Tax=Neocloeon triangulifer TaxID=2078957 RepID=UPI00286EEF8C|nr:NAD-dependent protein deacetylase sirtuin-7 [Neocloeon triangulifer]
MDDNGDREAKYSRRRVEEAQSLWLKQERTALYKKVTAILQKDETERTQDEKDVLLGCDEVAQEVSKRLKRQQQLKSRIEEVEDPPSALEEKCRLLAGAIAKSRNLVVYSGAGISTAARIPDYRGPNGVWTLLQQGKDVGSHDLSLAEPTQTHMALSQLYHCGRLKHVVSQNCDGLHLRSGLPKKALSEVHGNMYLEVCRSCKPPREYLRLFDVTERTARFNHKTGRLCHMCGEPLQDTIVHFGERGSLQWPLNWHATTNAARTADVILCLGSSLKVLKKYPWLWCLDMPVKKRPLLYIVNLQWTPKDDQATLKINGRCDEVFLKVMSHLKIPIPEYNRLLDPIFTHATHLHPSELRTTSRPFLQGAEPVKTEVKESLPAVKEESPAASDLNPRLDFAVHQGQFVQREHNYCVDDDKKFECHFCWINFSSAECFFYPSRQLTEKAILSDLSSEEEENSDEGPSNTKKCANPGWFGKGYRKTCKNKRKKV